MAGMIASTGSDDALLEDDYAGASKPRKGKASGKKSKAGPPKKFGKGKAKAKAQRSGRHFRGMKNGVKDSGPGPSRIAQAMGAPC